MTGAISIEGLAKRFARVEALAPLELQVPEGQILRYPRPNGASDLSGYGKANARRNPGRRNPDRGIMLCPFPGRTP